MEPLNSLAARDVRSVIHPFTDLAHHVEEGPLLLSRGEGVYVIDEHEHNGDPPVLAASRRMALCGQMQGFERL